MFNPLGDQFVLFWNLIAMVISLVAVMLVVQINGILQRSGKISATVTRKVVHIFAAPVFAVTWLSYAADYSSRFFAAVVPSLFVLLFVGVGTEKIKNDAFVASMSRTGNPRELLKGTLFYSIMILIITLFWFYMPGHNPAALLIFGCLAGGDGLADIIGRKYGGNKKFGFGGAEKTLAGSVGMFVGSLLFSYALIAIFSIEGNYNFTLLFVPVLLSSLIATFVEAISPKHIDNFTIPIGVILTVLLLWWLLPAYWPFLLWTL